MAKKKIVFKFTINTVLKLGFVVGKGRGAYTQIYTLTCTAATILAAYPGLQHDVCHSAFILTQRNQPRPSHRRVGWFSSSQPEFHTPRETWDTLPSSSQVTQLGNLFLGQLCRQRYFLTSGSIFYFVAFTCKQEHWWCKDQRTACRRKATKNEFSGWKEERVKARNE